MVKCLFLNPPQEFEYGNGYARTATTAVNTLGGFVLSFCLATHSNQKRKRAHLDCQVRDMIGTLG